MCSQAFTIIRKNFVYGNFISRLSSETEDGPSWVSVDKTMNVDAPYISLLDLSAEKIISNHIYYNV